MEIPELAMPRAREVTIVRNGKREVWEDSENTKGFFRTDDDHRGCEA